jgi:DNA-binding beta-propeller fold protein YncE
MVRFVTADPSGRRVALAGENGLHVRDLDRAGGAWDWGGAQARCAAAWSADGTRVAAAAGERREAVVLVAEDGAVGATVPVTGVPQHLAFDPGGSLLAVATDDGLIALCEAATGAIWCRLKFAAASLAFSADGTELRATGSDGRRRSWPLALPVAFREWREPARGKADGAVFDMAFSPDGTRLLTVTNGCIAVWSVAAERQTGHHLLENQRIDVRASAWWLGANDILLQVPGGWERLAIDAAGKPGPPSRVPKVPGSTVLDVRPDGGWIVAVADESGEQSGELWPGGDPERAQAVPLPPAVSPAIAAAAAGLSAVVDDEGAIVVSRADGSRLRLMPPLDPGIRALRISPDGGRLIVLTRLHRVFSWDLAELSKSLDGLGL